MFIVIFWKDERYKTSKKKLQGDVIDFLHKQFLNISNPQHWFHLIPIKLSSVHIQTYKPLPKISRHQLLGLVGTRFHRDTVALPCYYLQYPCRLFWRIVHVANRIQTSMRKNVGRICLAILVFGNCLLPFTTKANKMSLFHRVTIVNNNWKPIQNEKCLFHRWWRKSYVSLY